MRSRKWSRTFPCTAPTSVLPASRTTMRTTSNRPSPRPKEKSGRRYQRFRFHQRGALTRIAEGQDPAYRKAVTTFAMKFQQFTSPVMAKGLEDTAFYRYNRLVSLNDVGGDLHASESQGTRFTLRTGSACATGLTPCWPPARMTRSAQKTCAPESMCSLRCRGCGGFGYGNGDSSIAATEPGQRKARPFAQ
jgi:hypothetical protein